ncbi:MAG: Mut7-C RNAse domain-containing protein [candidate division NC10 bacterium]|nr:Mut7-C RNAse domain-containing protein [candidate division NC10 bacterium]
MSGDHAANPAAEPPRFLVDTMLGRLATWLRILGCDAAYFRGEDRALLDQAWREDRILLTRDARLLRRRRLPPHLTITSDRVAEQLRQVVRAFGLQPSRLPARRCPRCNLPLTERDRESVAGRVPEFVWSHHEAFWACPGCQRIYWAGSHRRRMEESLRRLAAGINDQ